MSTATLRRKADRTVRYLTAQADNLAAFGHHQAADEYRERAIKAAVVLASFGPACSDCGRSLRDPDSIERGVGPVCAHKP